MSLQLPKFLLAMCAILSIGASYGGQLNPPAYLVAEIDVHDPETFNKQYVTKLWATVEHFGGHALSRGNRADQVEGDAPKSIIIIEFKDMDTANTWYHSPEYAAIKPIRLASSTGRVYFAEGVPRSN